jgi:hypothetical protein
VRGSTLRASSVLGLALALGCTPPPSFPESSPDVDDASLAPPAPAAFTSISGRELPLHSSGEAEGEAWVLHQSGFSGVFLRLEKRAHITIRVTAAGAGQLVLALGERVQSFGVVAEPKPYEYALDMPPGTQFLRIDTASPLPGKQTELRVSNVSVSGAEFVKDVSDRLALDAANTFIQNERKGAVQLHVHGVDAGGAFEIRLQRHAFDFGVSIGGAQSRLLTAQPAPDSEAARFQELVSQHFNAVALATGAAQTLHEPEREPLARGDIARFLTFARDNALHARLQRGLADTDPPPAGVASKNSERIAQAEGGDPKLYLDELDVPPARDGAAEGSADPFGNQYRWRAEELRRAKAPLGALGVPYRSGGHAAGVFGASEPSPSRSFGVLQNLSGTGFELALTEFAIGAGEGVSVEHAADLLEETLRLVFGTPGAAAVVLGSGWVVAGDEPRLPSALFDEHGAPTPVGVRYEALMKEWDTQLNAPLGADGSLEFAGFYGAYLVQSGGKSGCLSVRKGQTDYELELQSVARGPNGALRRCRSL